MVGVAAPHRPGIDVDAAQVHRPDQRRQRVDDQQVGAAPARELDGRGAQEAGLADGSALLEEVRAGRPVRVALEDGGAVEAAGQGSLTDREVVVDELALGDPTFGEEELIAVADREVPAVDLDGLGAHSAA